MGVQKAAQSAQLLLGEADGLVEEVAAPLALRRTPARGVQARALAAAARWRWPATVYAATWSLLITVAAVNGALRHHSLAGEVAHWDGVWYGRLAEYGYPGHVVHAVSTLGFFPLYPLVVRATGHALAALTGHSLVWAVPFAGMVVSGLGGLVAAVLVAELATGWWGTVAGRRATLLFCLFPGSVVFVMVYAEGLMLPLAAGCLLALQGRRWLLAGGLAGLATATEPEALVLVVVCAVAALLEARRRGWRPRAPRGAWMAPLLALSGVGAFAAFLWVWTGTPLATLEAQRSGWHERTDPLAVVHLAQSLAAQMSFAHFDHPTINLNLVVGLVGAILLVAALIALWASRPLVSVEALVWTLGIGFLALTSEYTPPNPRLLLTAFPAVLVAGYYVRGKAFAALAAISGALLVVLSALTFVGTTLRP